MLEFGPMGSLWHMLSLLPLGEGAWRNTQRLGHGAMFSPLDCREKVQHVLLPDVQPTVSQQIGKL